MANRDKPTDLIGYPALQVDAMRGVVRAALQRASGPHGLPGEHHFYISFHTHAPGVMIPEELRIRYPDEMVIVLQNQYWDLNPGDRAFSVTLQFSGQPKSLFIPYAAVTRFYDPSVPYLLQFEPAVDVETEAEALPAGVAALPDLRPTLIESPKVVALDQFRKK